MKRIFIISVVVLAVTAGGAFAQMGGGMGGGQNMMGTAEHRPGQPEARQGGQPYYGMMGGYGMGQMHPGMMTGYGVQMPMMGGYGMGQVYPGMMGYGMHPGMMGGYGVQMPMMGYGMQQPMMGYGTGQAYPGMMGGYGIQVPMMGYGMPHMYPGAGVNVEKQREFLKRTSRLRRNIHDLMFDYMEAQWNPDTKPEKLAELGKELQGLHQELHEKAEKALK